MRRPAKCPATPTSNVAERQRVEEAGEGGDVARQPLVEHLLLQVVVHVTRQGASMVGGVVVRRHQSAVQRLEEIEIGDFAPRKRMQGEPPCPPAEQVRPPALEFSRTRTAQDEAQPVALDEAMHLVEQRRHLLHLVHDDGRGARRRTERPHPLPQPPRRPGELEQKPGVEQVEAGGVWKPLPQQRGLAGLARPPQERRLARRQVDVEQALVVFQIGRRSESVKPTRSVAPKGLLVQDPPT